MGQFVVHEVQRDRVGVVRDFLAEGVRQPGKPPHAHPHREVLPLDKAGRNRGGVGLADDDVAFAADTLRGAVALLIVGGVPVWRLRPGR